MNRLKILMVTETASGGGRKHIVDLLLGLDKSRYDITFVYSARRADSTFIKNLDELKAANINLVELFMERELKPAADFRSFLELHKIIKKIKPDIIHLHAAKAGALGRLAAFLAGYKKIIYNPHGGSFHKFNDRLGFIYFLVEKLLATRNIHFVGVSEFACNQFEETLHIRKDRNHLIYNGVDLKDSRNDENAIRLKSGFNKDDFLVLLPALFYPEKGHLNFLDSFSQLNEELNPKIKILFAGNGPLEEKIKQKVNDLKLQNIIFFLGFVQEMETYFRTADLVILPSLKEFLPYAILEAMSYCKPVLSTDTGSINEMIQHKINGELFSLNDLSSLWKRINYFSDHPEELKQMGNNSGNILKDKFSIAGMIGKTEELYDKLFYTS
ncbi:MAG: glycosyltransferase family 1 protein [Ignavibacteriales bacterium]|nr:MAG: glycosyltransferase family 1 protein [Ignavibacteriales bacterium]